MIRQRGKAFQAVVKYRQQVVATKTFDTYEQAVSWHDFQRDRYVNSNFVAQRGNKFMRDVVKTWLVERERDVERMTFNTDKVVLGLLPSHLLNRRMRGIEPVDLQMVIDKWSDGLKVSSVRRYADSLRAFFAWAAELGYVPDNLMDRVRLPKRRKEPHLIAPFTEAELDLVSETIGGYYGQITKVLGYSGLRWAEMRALRVKDVLFTGAYWRFNIVKSHPEGADEKPPKSGRSRTVPVAPQIQPIILEMSKDRAQSDYLISRDGKSQIWRSRFVSGSNWDVNGHGRTIHDLRHTAACNWLMRGVPVNTVQAWLGHSDLEATNIYTSYLGMDINPGAFELLKN